MIRRKPQFSLSRHRRIFLAELAESIAEEYSPGESRVEPDVIAKEHQITISRNDYGGCFDGLLQYRGGRFHIFCNLPGSLDRGDARARFSVAHELGHYFIPEHRRALLAGRVPAHPSFWRDPQSLEPENQVEAEADFFASRLLLPENRARRALDTYGRDLEGLWDVARVFGTSVEATVRRAVEIPDSLLAMVLFRRDATNWHRVSPRLDALGLRGIKVVQARAHPGSATWQAHAAKSPADVFRSTTSASHWFRHVRPGGPTDLVLREEAFRNRFYVLTLLTASPQTATP